MKVTVLGAGGWGTALAKLLTESQHEVTLWAHDPSRLEQMARAGLNERYLPGIALPRGWKFESRAEDAIASAACVVVAVPSKAFREVTSCLGQFTGIVRAGVCGVTPVSANEKNSIISVKTRLDVISASSIQYQESR